MCEGDTRTIQDREKQVSVQETDSPTMIHKPEVVVNEDNETGTENVPSVPISSAVSTPPHCSEKLRQPMYRYKFHTNDSMNKVTMGANSA